MTFKKSLCKLIPLMVRQAHHERNQRLTVRPKPVEGSLSKDLFRASLIINSISCHCILLQILKPSPDGLNVYAVGFGIAIIKEFPVAAM